jgi:hypothetical protein
MSVCYLLWHRHFCGHISSTSNNDLAHVVSLYQYLLSTYGRNLSRYIIDDQTHSPPFIDSWTRICNLPSQAEEVGKGGRYPPEWNFHVINWSRVFMPYIKGISNINPRIPGLKKHSSPSPDPNGFWLTPIWTVALLVPSTGWPAHNRQHHEHISADRSCSDSAKRLSGYTRRV